MGVARRIRRTKRARRVARTIRRRRRVTRRTKRKRVTRRTRRIRRRNEQFHFPPRRSYIIALQLRVMYRVFTRSLPGLQEFANDRPRFWDFVVRGLLCNAAIMVSRLPHVHISRVFLRGRLWRFSTLFHTESRLHASIRGSASEP